MGELKGQILGLILVIILFGTVGVLVKGVFKNSVEQITDRMLLTVSDVEDAD